MASGSNVKGASIPMRLSNSTSNDSRPAKSSSLRNIVEPKLYAIDSDEADETGSDGEDDDDGNGMMEVLANARNKEVVRKEDNARTGDSASTPAGKAVGRYERPEKIRRGSIGAALEAAASQRVKDVVQPESTPNRTQFEQQEDFIRFDASPPPPSSTKMSGSARGTKRRLDVYEDKQEEGTQRVQKRERERTTPWLEAPGVDWSQCHSAIAMYAIYPSCQSFSSQYLSAI